MNEHLVNIIGNRLTPLSFQSKLIDKVIKHNNCILSMPTGSGKTIVAYNWANIFYNMNTINDFRKIIFTSPLKSISNERYSVSTLLIISIRYFALKPMVKSSPV